MCVCVCQCGLLNKLVELVTVVEALAQLGMCHLIEESDV